MKAEAAGFSVIIPSRNRPELLARAVRSVLEQRGVQLEVVVVDDGSDDPVTDSALGSKADNDGIRIVRLPARELGHGPAFSRNAGVAASRFEYVAFLDDDDEWTQTSYLADVANAIAATPDRPPVLVACQEAVNQGSPLSENLWLNALARSCAPPSGSPDYGYHKVGVPVLAAAGAFAHLNTLVVAKPVFIDLGGFDESLRYEEDLDFYLRLIDRVGGILLSPAVIARHYVPNRALADNASTQLPLLQKLNIRLRLLFKNELELNHPELTQYCRRYASDTLKRMAQICRNRGDKQLGARYAVRALSLRFTFKWMGVCLLYGLSALTGNGTGGD